MSRVDRTLAVLAEGQHGLITLQQAKLHGLGEGEVRRRLSSGRWERAGRGVYRMAGSPVTPSQQALAACLAAPDGALSSYLTAGWIQGLWSAAPPVPHLTVAVGRSNRSTTAVVHRARLGPTDATWYDGIPVTSPARTLIDCASILGPNQLQRMVDTAFHQRLVTVRAIEVAWDHARLQPGRHGERKLRAAVDPWRFEVRPGSPAEVRLRQLVVQWGYPEPEIQPAIRNEAGKVIARPDLGWSGPRIGLEHDSEEFHGPSRWEADNARHRAITALGWQLLHADKTDLLPGERNLQRALEHAWATASVD